jgi:hypothetical protein
VGTQATLPVRYALHTQAVCLTGRGLGTRNSTGACLCVHVRAVGLLEWEVDDPRPLGGAPKL